MNLIEQIKVNDVSIDGYQGTYYTESPEYVKTTIDADGRLIEGIKTDGTKVIGGDLQVNGNINNDGIQGQIDAAIEEIQEEVNEMLEESSEKLSYFESEENPEWINVTTDAEGKILEGITSEGKKKVMVDTLFEDDFSAKKVDIDGATIESIQDQEGRTEIKTDSEGKILSYRDSDGIIHENVGIETSKLTLSEDGLNDFQKALKANGFNSGTGDWTDYVSNDGESPLNLVKPKCAMVNIICTSIAISSLTKEGESGAVEGTNYNVPSYIEYWDMDGNYFKKPILLSAQGQGTLTYPKKNLAIDLFDTSVYDSNGKLGKGDAFKIKFGNWISCDSFHLKGFLDDITRCRDVVSYKTWLDVVKTRGFLKEYQWKKALINPETIPYTDRDSLTQDEMTAQSETGATCTPDGFPIILFYNGEFFGIYMWRLKKDRNNYKLNKKEAKHVWLDSVIFDVFDMNGDLDWEIFSRRKKDSLGFERGMEIRNPKDLYCINTANKIVKYNFDSTDKIGELIDSTMQGYDSSNKDHVRTNAVKKVIITLSEILPALRELDAAYDANPTQENLQAFKTAFEVHFDVENLIDYQITSQYLNYADNWANNWLWWTYDGGTKWWVGIYDCDGTLNGDIPASLAGSKMFPLMIKYYKHELVERYRYLRDNKILDAEKTMEYFREFDTAWGEEYFNLEINKWSSLTHNDSLPRIYIWLLHNIEMLETLYVENN